MRLPFVVLAVSACLALLFSAARTVGSALQTGTGCLVYFQRFSVSRHGVYYWVAHHDLLSHARLESKPIPALERRYQTPSPNLRYITAARVESVAAYYGDNTFRLVLRAYSGQPEVVLVENIRVHNPLHMTPAVWTAWTANSRILHYAWQTPTGESFVAAYDVHSGTQVWRIHSDGRAIYRLLTLRDDLINADRLVRATNRANFYRQPCAPIVVHPNEVY